VKQLQKDNFAEAANTLKKGAVVTCTVSAVTDGGLEVTVSDGLSGFIKKADLSRERSEPAAYPAAEERERRQRSPLGLVMAVLGGGAALGLALFFAFRPKPTTPVNPPVTEAQPNITAPTNPPAPPPTPTPVDPNNLPPVIPPPNENTTPPPENTLGPNAPDPGGHVPENPTPTGDNPPTSENPGVEPQVVQQLASNTRRGQPRRATTTTTRPAQPAGQGTSNGSGTTTTPPPPSSSGRPAMEEARACFGTSNQNDCIINALRGRASSERELALLASTYQDAGQRADAIRTMRTYLQRYPNGNLAARYQDLISRAQ